MEKNKFSSLFITTLMASFTCLALLKLLSVGSTLYTKHLNSNLTWEDIKNIYELPPTDGINVILFFIIHIAFYLIPALSACWILRKLWKTYGNHKLICFVITIVSLAAFTYYLPMFLHWWCFSTNIFSFVNFSI